MDSNGLEMVKAEPLGAEQRALMLQQETSVWLNVAKFEQAQRVATMLSKTDFIPQAFRNNVGNCMIALDLAERMKAHPIMLMQTMYIVHGRPGFEGKFISALVNNSGRYEGKLKYEWKGEKGKPEWGCRAWAILKGSDERVNGPWVDWAMVVAEGWNKPKGSGPSQQVSKWMTMPELMFGYRAATFFGRTHDSDLLMGMSTIEEIEDTENQMPAMIKQPDGSFAAATDKPKTADLYKPTQESPKAQAEPEPTTAEPPPKQEQGNSINPWFQDWGKSKLKATGVKDFAYQNKDTFAAQRPQIRQAFEGKWRRCSELAMVQFPFDADGNWRGYEISMDVRMRFNELWVSASKEAKKAAAMEIGSEPTASGYAQPHMVQIPRWIEAVEKYLAENEPETPQETNGEAQGEAFASGEPNGEDFVPYTDDEMNSGADPDKF